MTPIGRVRDGLPGWPLSFSARFFVGQHLATFTIKMKSQRPSLQSEPYRVEGRQISARRTSVRMFGSPTISSEALL